VDWLFWAFVFVAGCAFAYKGVARSRVRLAEEEASACLAKRDAACVAASIERGRRFASSGEPRLDIAGAGLAILTGDTARAIHAAGLVKALPDLDATARGELLLVEGDIAEAQGDLKGGRDDWAAAAPFLTDGSLVGDRRSRADRAETDRAYALSAELSALSSAFDELFTLAQTAASDRISVRAGDLNDRLRHLPESDGRAKLLRAVNVAMQAAGAAAHKRAPFAYDPFAVPPAAPVDPSPETLRFDPHARERELAEYGERLARYRSAKSAYEERKAQGEIDAQVAARSMLEEGTRLVQDGLLALAPTTAAAPAAGAP
jgi:hypothetical protein